MSHQPGDVVTMSKRGQWVNRVEGEEELSQGYATKEEAIEAGQDMADALGTHHRVVDAEPTGTITDEQNADDQDAVGEARADGEDDADGEDEADGSDEDPDRIEVEDLP